MSAFVDANVFLRFLARDDAAKTAACLALFERAARGDVELHTSEAIVAEVVYVLTSPRLYAQPRDQVATGLASVLHIRRLRVDHKEALLDALDQWANLNHLDFSDCLAIAHALRQDAGSLMSYDRDYDRIAGITRIEPKDWA